MASKKISQLTPVTPLLTDLVPLDRPTTGAGAPVTGHATLSAIQALIDTTGTSGTNYWIENGADLIYTTGSVEITGSLSQGHPLNTAAGLYVHVEGEGTTTQMLGFQVDSIAPDGDTPTYSVFTLNSSYGDISTGIQNIGNNSAPLTYFLTNGAVSTTHEDRRVYELVGANYESGRTHVTCSNPLGMYDYDGTILASFIPPIVQQQFFGLYPDTIISGTVAHAEGRVTSAIGSGSHAEGALTFAIGVSRDLITNGPPYNSYGAHAEGALTLAYGAASHAEGDSTTASGDYSHSEGKSTSASGDYSHSEGNGTTASGYASHAEGFETTASGDESHAEGDNTTASGNASHAEGASGGGGSLVASGYASHAEGYNTTASGQYSHAEGDYTTASGEASHSEGDYTTASGSYSHAEGTYTIADGLSSHAEGWGSATHLRGFTVVYVNSDGVDPANGIFQLDSVYGDITTDIQNASNITSLMVTDGDIAGGFIGDRRVYEFIGTNFESPSTWITCSNLYGMNPQALFPYTGSIIASLAPLEWQLSTFTTPPDQAITGTISHAEGIESIAIGSGSHAEGFRTLAIGVSKDLTFFNSPGDATWGAHAEGLGTIAYGNASHSEGNGTLASGDASHSEGVDTLASGDASHAEGAGTTASGDYSHAEGSGTTASGDASHAEGAGTTASGDYSHAEGDYTTASGDYSHSEGDGTLASGDASHAEGASTIASGDGSHAEGAGTTASGDYSHAEGGGTTASGIASHAEGASVEEGAQLIAAGYASHAEGEGTAAVGYASHAEGQETIASGSYQHVQGKFNLRNNDFSIFVIGNGIADDDVDRSDVVRVNLGTPGSGSFEVTGTIRSTLGFSGSLTQLTDGRSYLVAGTDISITTASDGQVTIDYIGTGGGGGGAQYWDSSQDGAIYTSGSALFRGPAGSNTSPADFGTDTFFYVSGSIGSKDTAVTGTAVFGGDVVISGTLHGGSPLKIGSGLQVTGTLDIKDGLSGSLTRLTNGSSYLVAGTNVTITSESNGQVTISSTAGGGGTNYWTERSLFTIYSSGSVEITGSLSVGEAVFGGGTQASGLRSFAQGTVAKSSGNDSHAQGTSTTASGDSSHAEGANTTASGFASHTEGAYTSATGGNSHAEGNSNTALGDYSHVEGQFNQSIGTGSHSEGRDTSAQGHYSHAEGSGSVSFGTGSHAEGFSTIASGSYQHVQGKFNLRNNDFSLFVIGDGTNNANRSDIVRVNSGSAGGTGRLEVTGSLGITVGMTGSLSYTPANGTHWADPDPTNVKDALDRIAALLYTLNSSTPIP